MPFVSALSFVGTTLLLTERNIGMRRVNDIFTNPTNIHAPKRMIGMPRILYRVFSAWNSCGEPCGQIEPNL